MSHESSNIKHLLEKYQVLRKAGSVFFSEEEIDILREHFIDQHLFDEALFILKYASETYPFSYGFRIDQAEVLLLYGKELKALKIIEEIELLEPYNAEALFMKASILSQMGRHQDAIDCLTTCLTYKYEDVVDIYFHIALEYQFLENYTQAVTHFSKVLEIEPTHLEALFEISVAYDLSNRLQDGILFFQNFIDQNPYSSLAWFHLGYMYNRLAIHDKALECFDYSSIIDENYVPAKVNKANTLCILEKHQEALDIYFEITQLQKPDSYLFYLIGEAYENLSEYEKALSYYKEATHLDKYNADAWLGMAVVKDLLNETRDGLKYTKKAIEIEPLNPIYWYAQAEFFQKLEMFEDACLSYDHVLELDPYNKEAWLDYSALLYEHNSKDMAIETLNEAIFFLPQESDLYYRLTAYYISNGSPAGASEVLADALKLNQDGYKKMLDDMPQLRKSKFIRDLLKIHQIHLQ